MAGSAIIIKKDDSQVKEMLGQVEDRLGDATPAFKAIGEIGRTSVIRNFEEGGRPVKWPEPKIKIGGKTLMRQGFAGGLAGSISYKAFVDKVILGTNKVYAAIHQFGFKGLQKVKAHMRKGKKVKAHTREMNMPAREYLMLQGEDWVEIKETLNDFIIMGET